MEDVPIHTGPKDAAFVDEDDVYDALAFLIAVEPDPEPDTRAAYFAALAPYQTGMAQAERTLRLFAEQTEPLDLETLRTAYYQITSHPDFETARSRSIVTTALNQAWKGVGGWRT